MSRKRKLVENICDAFEKSWKGKMNIMIEQFKLKSQSDDQELIDFFEKSEYIKFAERESTRDEAKLDKKKVLQWMDDMEFSKLEALEKKKTGEIMVNGEADATRL